MGSTLAHDSVEALGAACANVGACARCLGRPGPVHPDTTSTKAKSRIVESLAAMLSPPRALAPSMPEPAFRSPASDRPLPTRPGGLEPPTYGFGCPAAFTTDRTISSPATLQWWNVGRVPGASDGGFNHLRCGGIAGAAHPLVSTPSASPAASIEEATRPASGSARDCPLPVRARRVSPNSPGSPRPIPGPGPSLTKETVALSC